MIWGYISGWKKASIFFHLSNSGLQLSRGERQGTLWKGHQSITGLTHGERQPFTPSVNLELPINFTPWMFLDCRRKPEYSEKTQRRGDGNSTPKVSNFFEVVLKILKLFFSKMEMEIVNKFWVRWQKFYLVAKIRWWVILAHSAIVHLSVSVSENTC